MSITSKKLKDRDWIRQSFLVGSTSDTGVKSAGLDPVDIRNQRFSTNQLKFTDTTPGGNIAINPPPQFTRNADIKSRSLLPNGKGMGRYYSEAIDDNSRVISMRFGVPTYTSLTTFWAGFYDSDIAALARTGKRKGVAYKVGQAIGYVIPLLSPVLFISGVIGNAARYILMMPSSKYYYLNPTMHLYWTAVNTIFNNIAVNKGVIPRVFSDETRRKLDSTYNFEPDDLKIIQSLLPDIMTGDGSINSYAIATKTQRNSRRFVKAMEAIVERSKDKLDLANELDKIQREGLPIEPSKHNGSWVDYIGRWLGMEKDDASEVLERSGTGGPYASTKEEAPGLMEFIQAELEDGAMFASFRVDSDGSVGESFSNQTGASEMANKFNSTSADKRNTRFSFAEGNVGDGMVLKTMQGILGGVKDLVDGTLNGIGASGLMALSGSAFVDIPNVWTGSTANLPRMNYTMTLTSPYGNKLSQLLNLYLPLSMLLAAALPLSTGRQSYTSPFLLELYDRGRAQTRLGIIDSLNITRGVGNLGFDRSGNAMSIDISFSVIDLSSVLHMPIGRGFGFNNILSDLFTDDTAFSDYMATLGSLSLQEQIYTGDRLKLAVTRQLKNFDDWASKANFANWAVDGNLGRIASIFYDGVVDR